MTECGDDSVFSVIKYFLVQTVWENWMRASEIICHLLDESLSFCSDVSDTEEMLSLLNSNGAVKEINVASLFFAFLKHFATGLTAMRTAVANEAVKVNFSSIADISLVGGIGSKNTQQQYVVTQQESKNNQKGRPHFFLPFGELWRQPSLVAGVERLAELLWAAQVACHAAGDGEEDDCLITGCCPLCYAASVEHVVGTDALWSLLEFYAVYYLSTESFCGDNYKLDGNSDAVASARHGSGAFLHLDEKTQCLLWTHAIAVCRNAVWNGAMRTARLCVAQWFYSGSHSILFRTTGECKEGFPVVISVGANTCSFSAFLLLQCCLLLETEAAFVSDLACTIESSAKHSNVSTNDNNCKGPDMSCAVTAVSSNDNHSHCYSGVNWGGFDNDNDDDDDGASSLQSSLTLQERGDEELCSSLIVLRDVADIFSCGNIFVALTMTTPHHALGGLPLLHWVCERGYESCVRLLLTTWLQTHGNCGLLPGAKCQKEIVEKRVKVDFQFTGTTESSSSLKKTTIKASSSRAILCKPLCFGDGVLVHAVMSGNASILRQLFLFGASRHQWCEDKTPSMSEDMLALLRNPDSVVDGAIGTLQERVCDALCATSAADALANAAWKLWTGKTRILTAGGCNDSETRRYHRLLDTVMRTSLAALEFDLHNVLARTTLLEALVRRVLDGRVLVETTGEAAEREKRYYMTARRMCEHLLTTHGEDRAENRSFLKSLPIFFLRPTEAAVGAVSSLFKGRNVCCGDGFPASVVIDEEQQQLTYALVNLRSTFTTGETLVKNSETASHPLWVRLPCDVDVERSLELVGGLYGLVESVMPLIASVECGDLVMFKLCKKFTRFDVTQIVCPREGAVVEVPCVLKDRGETDKAESNGELTVRVLRCAVVPSPECLPNNCRRASDPLHWIETSTNATSDVVQQIHDSRWHLWRWLRVANFGRCALWFHDVPQAVCESSVWRFHTSFGKANTRYVLATAAFPSACCTGMMNADDLFGLTSEAIFLLEPQGQGEKESGGIFRVVGVFPVGGWECT